MRKYVHVEPATNRFFVATNGLDMLSRRIESCTHSVQGDMRRTQRTPTLRLTNPLVKITLASIHARFDAYSTGIAARFRDIAYKALKDLAHLVIRFSLREPAIAYAGYTSQQYIGTATQPYGDGAT